jgi:hypothetical protein
MALLANFLRLSRLVGLARGAVFLASLSATVHAPASPTPTPSPSLSHLANISTRLNVGVDDDVLIGGFIVRGPDPKRMILRALGPSLTRAGVSGAMANPTLELHDSTGATIATNDDWQTSGQASEIRASGLAPTNPLESAIVATLQPGNYTAIVRGVNNSTGIALIEGYELDSTATRLVNVSTRGRVGVGDEVLIGGVILAGSDSKTVMVRALGPSLGTGAHPLAGVLVNPVLELHDGSGNLLASNDDWVNSPQHSAIAATGLAPSNSLESAILSTLSPGNYTAIVRGANNTTGVGLVEVYDLDPVPTREVWIAARTDGVAGSGTEVDPYDGSAQPEFDAVMNGIPENTAIHLGAGTFQTRGALAWQPKNNWIISGAGMNATAVMQTAIQEGQFQVIGHTGGPLAQNLIVSDLTVDCNYINLSTTLDSDNKAIGAIAAQNGHFSNVRVIHAGGNRETFTLGFDHVVGSFGTDGPPPSLVEIENCRVEQSGPNVTAMWASDSQTANGYDSVPQAGEAIIRNCYVEGSGDFIHGGIGFQVNGYQSTVIDHCSTVGCTFGFYRDTFPQAGVTITNCNINSLNSAISILGGQTSLTNGVMIRGSTLAAGGVIVNTANATNVTIQNNAFFPGPNYTNWWQPIQTTSSTYILNNQFDPAITDGRGYIAPGSIYGNRHFDGTIVPFLRDNYSP